MHVLYNQSRSAAGIHRRAIRWGQRQTSTRLHVYATQSQTRAPSFYVNLFTSLRGQCCHCDSPTATLEDSGSLHSRVGGKTTRDTSTTAPTTPASPTRLAYTPTAASALASASTRPELSSRPLLIGDDAHHGLLLRRRRHSYRRPGDFDDPIPPRPCTDQARRRFHAPSS